MLILTVVIPFIIAVLALLPYPALVNHQRRHDSARLLGGGAWAVWRYPDAKRLRTGRAGLVEGELMLGPLLGLACTIAFAFFFGIFLGDPFSGALFAGLILGVGVIVLVFVTLPTAIHTQRRRAVHASGLREVAIGPIGICEDGLYTPLTLVGWGSPPRSAPPAASWGYPLLSAVTLQPGPTTTLTFTRIYPRAGTHGHGSYFSGSSVASVRVAVPRGCEEEAAALVKRFREHLAWLPERLIDHP